MVFVVLDPTDLHCMESCNILMNILFLHMVLQKKESHTGLERHEGDKMTEFSFVGELSI